MASEKNTKADKQNSADLNAEQINKKESMAVFKRCNFSLTDAVSQDIDRLALIPRTFKFNRSEVVKAGVEALKLMPEEEMIAFFEKIKSEE